ncbi:MAG: metal-dependent phosphohydrolase [Actinomycetota bacterium]
MKLDDMPVWRELDSPEAVADALIDLYERKGSERYNEVVTQVEHGLQTAGHGIGAGATEAEIVAAFLHDVGHLILDELERDPKRATTDLHHEDIGGRFLANWFGPDVTTPVELHVPAKRYLCAVEPDYADSLSPASVHSLEMQGGPMSADEVEAFAATEHTTAAVELRRWDDWGKVEGAPSPTMADMRDRMVALLSASMPTADG